MNSHYDLANLPNPDLKDIFLQVSMEMGIPPALVEKDFWVSFLLKYLYQDSPWKEKILFKGGTCLSKCYEAIHRFSEDIDLLLDWRILGYPYTGPAIENTRKKQEKSNEILLDKTMRFVTEELYPKMKNDLNKILDKGFDLTVSDTNVIFKYPSSLNPQYIKNEILMEIGPRGIWGNSTSKTITSYVCQHLPELCEERIVVHAISLDRAFCEKLLILHTVACKEKLPERYSRHYYDVASICRCGQLPVVTIQLIEECTRFKSRFFPGTANGYESVLEGSMKLIPPESIRSELDRDYRAMSVMIFGIPPSLDEIIDIISEYETNLSHTHERLGTV